MKSTVTLLAILCWTSWHRLTRRLERSYSSSVMSSARSRLIKRVVGASRKNSSTRFAESKKCSLPISRLASATCNLLKQLPIARRQVR